MYEDKCDEVAEFLKEECDTDNPTVNEIIEMVMNDIFKDFHTEHLGTFAEIKSANEFNKMPFPDNMISQSACGWATRDIQETLWWNDWNERQKYSENFSIITREELEKIIQEK